MPEREKKFIKFTYHVHFQDHSYFTSLTILSKEEMKSVWLKLFFMSSFMFSFFHSFNCFPKGFKEVYIVSRPNKFRIRKQSKGKIRLPKQGRAGMMLPGYSVCLCQSSFLPSLPAPGPLKGSLSPGFAYGYRSYCILITAVLLQTQPQTLVRHPANHPLLAFFILSHHRNQFLHQTHLT
jgi:hypothetical protein